MKMKFLEFLEVDTVYIYNHPYQGDIKLKFIGWDENKNRYFKIMDIEGYRALAANLKIINGDDNWKLERHKFRYAPD